MQDGTNEMINGVSARSSSSGEYCVCFALFFVGFGFLLWMPPPAGVCTSAMPTRE